MNVDVTLYSPLKKNRFSRSVVSVSETATVSSLLTQLSIKQYEVGSVYINKQSSTFETKLEPDDIIEILPLIGGG